MYRLTTSLILFFNAYIHRLMTIIVSLVVSTGFIVSDSTASDQIDKLDRAQVLFNKNDIDIDGKYKILRFVSYEGGGGMVWVIPLYKGLPIFLHERAFHFKAGGKVKRDRNGNVFVGGGDVLNLEGLDIDTNPRITEKEAKDIFAQHVLRGITIPDITGRNTIEMEGPACAANPEALNAELGIYDRSVSGRHRTKINNFLAWKIACEGESSYVFVDAQGGVVLNFDSGRRSFLP